MTEPLKKTIMHGLELLGVVAGGFILEFLLNEIVPQLPQTSTVMIIATLLGAVLKYMRANPNIRLPDYVNGDGEAPLGRV